MIQVLNIFENFNEEGDSIQFINLSSVVYCSKSHTLNQMSVFLFQVWYLELYVI